MDGREGKVLWCGTQSGEAEGRLEESPARVEHAFTLRRLPI
jgi:hypothetical protein